MRPWEGPEMLMESFKEVPAVEAEILLSSNKLQVEDPIKSAPNSLTIMKCNKIKFSKDRQLLIRINL
jgi:hypothetical protein